MRIEKEFTLNAAQKEVWDLITAPDRMASCVPGCQEVKALGEGKYRVTIKIKVGPIKTTFCVDVESTEQRPPEYAAYLTSGEEGSKASRVKAESALILKAIDANTTSVTYQSDVSIVGRLGKFGTGVMQKKADSMGEEFVAELRKLVEGEQPAAEATEQATVAKQPAKEPKAASGSSMWGWVATAAVVIAALYFLSV
ncbi:MAG: SRPBCC domain-containing protein [Pseudomonadales bacterium]